MRLAVKNKLVYSPHVYGPDVFNISAFKEANFPKNLPAIWDSQWGYIRKGNNRQNNLAPIVIGEWGGRNNPNTPDRVWHNAISQYFIKNGFACATFYWSLNPNSGDTHGIIADDWKTPIAHKLDVIRSVCTNPTDVLTLYNGYLPLAQTETHEPLNEKPEEPTNVIPQMDTFPKVPFDIINHVFHIG